MKDRKRARGGGAPGSEAGRADGGDTAAGNAPAAEARAPGGAPDGGRDAAESAAPGAGVAAGGGEGSLSGEALTERLSAEIERELAELEELRDRHLRLAAEFENYRKRTRREQAETREVAQADLVRGLLDTLDDLARMADTAELADAGTLRQGLDLIHRKLRKALEDAGLSRIEALGAPFDPSLHEGVAIAEVEDPAADETVARVLADGYRFRERLLRPARVAVARYAGAGTPADGGDSGEA